MEIPYLIRRAPSPAPAALSLDDPMWQHADELEVSHFHPRSSNHRPCTLARVLYDAANLFVRFDVDDRYVVSQATQCQDSVCFDSCVEFFFRPKRHLGYFNVEINCGGTFLFHYNQDLRQASTPLIEHVPINPERAKQLTISRSMPSIVFPERPEPTRWQVACRIPLSVLEPYVGALGNRTDWHWDANFFKCADHSSHPHWASWSPMGEALNFHQPRYFQPVAFE
jgi:hypothetical protein